MERNEIKDQTLLSVLSKFCFDSQPVSCKSYGCGHINQTYLVVCESNRRYILQRINRHVFSDVPALMKNITLVTEHLRKEESDPRKVLTLIQTKNGETCLKDAGEYWRAYNFVEHSICLQQAENIEDFYESASAFGNFEEKLKDFPIEKLYETIPNFHNTPDRYRIFYDVLEKDSLGRKQFVEKEIQFVLKREEEMQILQKMREQGKLPVRVTHNDTKLNNVLLDETTRKALCVIDLDTVMPGLSLYDYGDSIRFGAATAAEDEKDLSKVEVSLEKFQIYTRGFVKAYPGLTETERENLPLGAKTMTLECGLRFLTDYLDGDHYFATHYEGQNLDRCRTQFKLVADMEYKWKQMKQIAGEISFSSMT